MLVASITCFSTLHGRPIFHEILIGVLLTPTTPITLMLLVCVTLYRDRQEGSAECRGMRRRSAFMPDRTGAGRRRIARKRHGKTS